LGDFVIDTAIKKFGAASGLMNNGDIAGYVAADYSLDFNIGLQPFDIDFWFRVPAFDCPHVLVWWSTDGSLGYYLYLTDWGSGDYKQFIFQWYSSALPGYLSLASNVCPMVVGSFHHFALTAKTNLSPPQRDFRFFFDGANVGIFYADAGYQDYAIEAPPSPTVFSIGNAGTVGTWVENEFHMDEFRLVIGDYVWDAPFVPPISEYSLGPTMDQLMRAGKWFSGGIFKGCWLGWR
jgi:hypothetical protein